MKTILRSSQVSGSNATHDQEKLEKFLERTMEDGTVIDGVVSQVGPDQGSVCHVLPGLDCQPKPHPALHARQPRSATLSLRA